MFGSDSLETAVGVIFLILLLGLVCSASNELIAMFMDSRARTLRKGLIKVLGGMRSGWKSCITIL